MDMPSMDVQKPNTERVAQKPISAKNASDRKVQMRRLNLFVLDAGPSIKVLPNAKDKDRDHLLKSALSFDAFTKVSIYL